MALLDEAEPDRVGVGGDDEQEVEQERDEHGRPEAVAFDEDAERLKGKL